MPAEIAGSLVKVVGNLVVAELPLFDTGVIDEVRALDRSGWNPDNGGAGGEGPGHNGACAGDNVGAQMDASEHLDACGEPGCHRHTSETRFLAWRSAASGKRA